MTETYSFNKNIPKIGLEIEVTVDDKELARKLDDAIRETIIKHYGLGR